MNNRKQTLVSTACACALVAQSLAVPAQDKPKIKTTEQSSERVYVESADNGTATFTVRSTDPNAPKVTFSGNLQPDSTWQSPDGKTFAFTQSTDSIFIAGQGGGGRGNYEFMAAEASFDSKVVKDAPYSAESLTEFTQTLADGNRLTRRASTMVYRDSQGRTRREQKVVATGLSAEWIGNSTLPTTTIINDPVEGTTIVLDQKQRVARRSRLMAARAAVPATAGALRITGPVTENIPGPAGNGEALKKINISGGVLQSSAINKVQPEYPVAAKAARVQGAVQVQITVGEKGEVVEASAISGHPLLRDAALTAARQWQFKPTQLSGVPVKTHGVLTFNFTLSGGNEVTLDLEKKRAIELEAAAGAVNGNFVRTAGAETRMNFNREMLGKQMIEGVECEGQRVVQTIPAGQIGNERAIEIINERWYSPELQVTVMTRQFDPRYGETVHRLTNLMRTEPDEYLFKVPSDYTVKEETFGFKMMEEKIRRPEER